MSVLRHYIDFLDGIGYVEVIPPLEWKELAIESVFAQNSNRLNTELFTWTGTTATKMNDYIEAGISGAGPGIYEALPYQVILECEGDVFVLIEAAINLAARESEFSCDIIKAPIRETGKIDFLTARADSFRFEVLASLLPGEPGRITASDYLDIWYMAGKYPQATETIIAFFTIFMVLKEMYESIKRFADIVAAISGGATGITESLLMAAALAIYMYALVAALAILLSNLVALIFPFVYFHRGMYNRTLFAKGAAFLGLGFSSTIFSPGSPSYDQYILPPKNTKGAIVGAISNEVGYFDGSYGQFLRTMIEEYNGEIKIIGNTLHFEREGFFSNLSTYKVPEVKQFVFKGTKAADAPANYVIEYLNDKIDLYNYDDPRGRVIQVTCEPINVFNKQNITIEGLVTRLVPMSLPNVKVTTSQLEVKMGEIFSAASSFLGVVASIITGSPFGSSPTIPSGGNINILQLDSHFISEHKTGIYGGGGKTLPTSNTTLGAYELLKNYHYPKIPKPIFSGIGNQWYKYKGDKVPLCCEDYLAIRDNNYGTYKGDLVRLTKILYYPYDEVADIEFEVNKALTNNLQARITEPYKPTIIL